MPEPLDAVATVDTHAADVVCPNCGAPLSDAYCGACGQKRISHHDLTVRHFLGHLAHEITHFESSKVFRTFVALVFKPGKLTVEYLAGRRSGYSTPIQLYLTASAAYFFFVWTPWLTRNGGAATIVKALEPLVTLKHIPPEKLAEEFFHAFKTSAGVARFVSALPLALCVQLLYLKTKRLYVEHLIFSLHYIAFTFALACALEAVRDAAAAAHVRLPFIGLVPFAVSLVYLFVAQRRVYKEGAAITAGRTLVLLVCEQLLWMGSVIIAAAMAIVPLIAH